VTTEATEGGSRPPLIVYGKADCPVCLCAAQTARRRGYDVTFMDVPRDAPVKWLLHNHPQFESKTFVDGIALPIITKVDGTLIGTFIDLLDFFDQEGLTQH
jgi:glutaredoxin